LKQRRQIRKLMAGSVVYRLDTTGDLPRNGSWASKATFRFLAKKISQNWSDPGLPALTPRPLPPPELLLDFVPRPGGPAAISHEWKFPWFGTLRLRAGMTPSHNWLLYVTGGLAVGETKYTFNFSQPGAGVRGGWYGSQARHELVGQA
jgi:opacity protein-like surface antigen